MVFTVTSPQRAPPKESKKHLTSCSAIEAIVLIMCIVVWLSGGFCQIKSALLCDLEDRPNSGQNDQKTSESLHTPIWKWSRTYLSTLFLAASCILGSTCGPASGNEYDVFCDINADLKAEEVEMKNNNTRMKKVDGDSDEHLGWERRIYWST